MIWTTTCRYSFFRSSMLDLLRHLDGDLGLYRIRYKTLLVGRMVKPVFVRTRWFLRPLIDNARLQHDGTDPRNTALVFRQCSDRFVLVALDLEPRFECKVEVRQQVTTRKRRDECLFGIDVRLNRVRLWDHVRRRRCRHGNTAVEAPGMGSGKRTFQKVAGGRHRPSNGGSVLGHDLLFSN